MIVFPGWCRFKLREFSGYAECSVSQPFTHSFSHLTGMAGSAAGQLVFPESDFSPTPAGAFSALCGPRFFAPLGLKCLFSWP